MKGIIIEKNKKQSVIMDNNGRFVKARTEKGWSEGSEVSFTSNAAIAAKTFSIAAALVLVLTLSLFGIYAANSYTVNLDVNPSISIELNAFNTVKDITALNDDAEQIGNLEELIGLKLGTAVNQAILLLVEEGYLDEDGTVVLSVEGNNNKVKTVTREVSESIANANVECEQENAGENGKIGEDGMNIYIGRITQEIAEAAEEFDLPYGRILLVDKANEDGANIDYEAAAVLSVREIQRIRNISKTLEKITEPEDEEDDNTNGSSNSQDQSKQSEAMSKKIYKEAAKIEDYLSELAAIIDAGEADEDILAEYAELSDQLDAMYVQLEESGIGTYDEVMNTVMSMTQSKGADAAMKARVKKEVETSLSGGQLGKPEDNSQQSEDNSGKGNEKGKDNGNSGSKSDSDDSGSKNDNDSDEDNSDSDGGSDNDSVSDDGNASSGSDSKGGSGSSGKGGN